MKLGEYSIKPPAGFVTGNFGTIQAYLAQIISLIIYVGIFLALLYLILGGIKYMASGGEKQAKASAKSQITYSLVGLSLLFISFLIINLLSSFWKVNLIDPNLTPPPCPSTGGPC